MGLLTPHTDILLSTHFLLGCLGLLTAEKCQQKRYFGRRPDKQQPLSIYPPNKKSEQNKANRCHKLIAKKK